MSTPSACWVEMRIFSTATGLLVHVAHRHLRLAVGSQVVEHVGLAHRGQALGKTMREVDRHRHQLRGLVARVAEHHALVAGAHQVDGVDALAVLDLERLVDALRDVRALLVDAEHHAARLGVEAVLRAGVADVGDDAAHDRGDLDVAVSADLAADDDQAGGGEALARAADVVAIRAWQRRCSASSISRREDRVEHGV